MRSLPQSIPKLKQRLDGQNFWYYFKIFRIQMYWKINLFDNVSRTVVKARSVCCQGSRLNYKTLPALSVSDKDGKQFWNHEFFKPWSTLKPKTCPRLFHMKVVYSPASESNCNVHSEIQLQKSEFSIWISVYYKMPSCNPQDASVHLIQFTEIDF